MMARFYRLQCEHRQWEVWRCLRFEFLSQLHVACEPCANLPSSHLGKRALRGHVRRPGQQGLQMLGRLPVVLVGL